MTRYVVYVFLLCALGAPLHATAAESPFQVTGIGGGGGLFSPSISDLDPNLMFVASDMGGVFRSTDGGNAWKLVPTKYFADAAASSAPAFFNKIIYWYSRNNLYSSVDNGATWTKLRRPWKRACRIKDLTAYREHGGYLFVSTELELWRLELSSGNWKKMLDGPSLAVVAMNNTLLAVADSVLYKSMNVGEEWHIVDNDLANNKIVGIAGSVDDSGSLLLLTLEGMGLYRSTDEGKSWTKQAGYQYQHLLTIPRGQTRIAWAAAQKRRVAKKFGKAKMEGVAGMRPSAQRGLVKTYPTLGSRRN